MKTLKRSRCAILRLVLKKKWFDMIASGKKREEYRDMKPYWESRLKVWKWEEPWDQHYWVVAFSLGYAKSSMFFLVADCRVRGWVAHPEWGEPETPHIVIGLDERIELED
jgi:hypothetical protein